MSLQSIKAALGNSDKSFVTFAEPVPLSQLGYVRYGICDKHSLIDRTSRLYRDLQKSSTPPESPPSMLTSTTE